MKLMTSTTLHPGDDCPFFSVVHTERVGQFDSQGYFLPSIEGIGFDIELYLLNEEPQRLKVVFGREDLRPGMVKTSQQVV
jgi:hypothetical protein